MVSIAILPNKRVKSSEPTPRYMVWSHSCSWNIRPACMQSFEWVNPHEPEDKISEHHPTCFLDSFDAYVRSCKCDRLREAECHQECHKPYFGCTQPTWDKEEQD